MIKAPAALEPKHSHLLSPLIAVSIDNANTFTENKTSLPHPPHRTIREALWLPESLHNKQWSHLSFTILDCKKKERKQFHKSFRKTVDSS